MALGRPFSQLTTLNPDHIITYNKNQNQSKKIEDGVPHGAMQSQDDARYKELEAKWDVRYTELEATARSTVVTFHPLLRISYHDGWSIKDKIAGTRRPN
jgi:hypothetical protein